MAKNQVKICPNCGSLNIDFENILRDAPNEYCGDCGYGKGDFSQFKEFPMIDKEDIESFQKEIKNKL